MDVTSQGKDSAISGLMGTLDQTDWDKQMEDDITTGNLDWLADEASGDSQAGRCSEL